MIFNEGVQPLSLKVKGAANILVGRNHVTQTWELIMMVLLDMIIS